MSIHEVHPTAALLVIGEGEVTLVLRFGGDDSPLSDVEVMAVLRTAQFESVKAGIPLNIMSEVDLDE